MSRRALAVLVLAALMAFGGLPQMGAAPSGGLGDALPTDAVEDPDPWSDPLDDLSRVYVPTGGLTGLTHHDGAVSLMAGRNEGWMASEVIYCPPGNRFDLVVLDATTPGDSRTEITILDPTAEATEVGYANGTISPYKDVSGATLKVRGLDTGTYPGIRVQVKLVGTSADRPVLHGWSLYYSGEDEWKDELVSQARLETVRNLNLTDGRVEIDMSRTSVSPVSSGTLFPTIIFNHYWTSGSSVLDVFYPNFDKTGYKDLETLPCKGTRGVEVADLNADGYPDIIMSNPYYNSGSVDSEIYWGEANGWKTTSPTALGVTRAYESATGDFDGDGDLDIAFACVHTSLTVSSMIFLNDDGEFDYEPDIVLVNTEYSEVSAGDVSGDGYDDILYTGTNVAKVYYGGPGGPDGEPDITLTVDGYVHDTLIEDIDGDGYMDMIVGNSNTFSKVPVYMGDSNGMDTTADYELALPDLQNSRTLSCGDINGDGHNELLMMVDENYKRWFYIFKGSESGWSSSDRLVFEIPGYCYASEILDINGDGYGDILGSFSNLFQVYYGGEEWPNDFPDISKDGLNSAWSMAVVTEGDPSTKRFKGRLVTETINLPEGKRWDLLDIEGAFPEGTSAIVTVQDGSGAPITGYKGLPDLNVDLSGLSARSIQIEVWLESDRNDTTPALDRIRVRWQDPEVWREQFFGAAKVDAMLGARVTGRRLAVAPTCPVTPDLLFTGPRGDAGYTTLPRALIDGTRLDYAGGTVASFPVQGAVASDAADVNDDGYIDLVFAVQRTDDSTWSAGSPLFLGSPAGWSPAPAHRFPTTGASDVLVEDLNGDGRADVVFAQERDAGTYMVNSTVFMGSATGWPVTPSFQLRTTGASGVAAADVDNDNDTDLVFSCYKSTSTATDSMVFLQTDEGFQAASDLRLAGMGARAVAAGDIDGDGIADVVLANSFSAGSAEVDSYIYWGAEGAAFEATPTPLRTSGATDVALADVDGDGDLDVAFASSMDNTGDVNVSSYVYINRGSGSFASAPDHRLPAVGASSIAVADIDGEGWLDVVLASRFNGTSYAVPSRVFLGGEDGWSAVPDMEIPTVGATHVLVGALARPDRAGYLSQAITPPDVRETGAFHTLAYRAHMEGSVTIGLSLVDAATWTTLATAQAEAGANAWDVADGFEFRDHPSVRVMVTLGGVDGAGDAWVDDLQLNWTPREHLPPLFQGLTVEDASIYRTHGTSITVMATDEFTPAEHMTVRVEHSLEGADDWDDFLMGKPLLEDGAWRVPVLAKTTAPLGTYTFRVEVTDDDGDTSGIQMAEATLEVLNVLPGTPEVRLSPARPVTTSTVQVEIVKGATDAESNRLTYHFYWYCDGVLREDITGSTLLPEHTRRGQNWSVEVRAFDGDDEGPGVTAWRVVQNAPPPPPNPLPDPYLDEDTTDSDWLDLSTAFEDPDGDPITWSLRTEPVHISVAIDPVTGRVTIVPEADWNGEETLTFVASDGELQGSQTVTVNVRAVNDIPRFVAVDGKPIGNVPVEFTVEQGETLIVHVSVLDVEGHELVVALNTSMVEWDGDTMQLTFKPDNDGVGTLRFGMRMNDVVSPEAKVSLDFAIHVENANDPMDAPKIVRPLDGDSYRVNQTLSLIATCFDPDIEYGQVLNYSWSSSISGHLGYGSSLTVSLPDEGTHVIMLRVNDGEFEKTCSIELVIEPDGSVDPPGGDPDDDPQDTGGGAADGGPSMGLTVGALIIIVAAAAGIAGMRARKGHHGSEPGDPGAPHISRDGKREVLVALAEAAKEAADVIENGRNGHSHGSGGDTSTPHDHEDGEGIGVDSMEVSPTILSMEAKVTEEASEDVAALWKGIDIGPVVAAAPAAPVLAADKEDLQLTNLKRKYQNAIASLPYGIPSKELEGWDWVDLSSALATGEKKLVEGNCEVTMIDGRWYHSDIDDASTFLKEHGARPETARASGSDHADATAELEEMLIMGRITEEDYRRLKRAMEE